MINFILTTALLLSSTSVSANSSWVVVGETNEIEFSIDTKSIQKSGDSITFWTRRNYATRQKDGSLSTRDQLTINCRTRDRTFRLMQTFDGSNNTGKILNTFESDGKWQPIPPDTIIWRYYEFVCKN